MRLDWRFLSLLGLRVSGNGASALIGQHNCIVPLNVNDVVIHLLYMRLLDGLGFVEERDRT
jgi:hypothetical protein